MVSRFGKLISVVFVIILSITIIDTLLSYKNLKDLKYDNGLINHSFTIITTIDNVFLDIHEAVIQQRNFLIANNNSYLTSYNSSKLAVKHDIDYSKNLIKENTLQQKRVDSLAKKINERINLLERGITLYKTEGFENAQAFIANGQGEKKMEEIELLTQSINQEERKLLTLRENQANISYLILYYDTALAGILNFTLIAIMYFFVRRELHVRNLLEYTKDEFISIASHELKTPITSLKMFTTLLRKEVARYKNIKANEFIEKINQQADRLVNLIKELLDITRIQTGKFGYDRKPMDLNNLTRETTEAMQEMTKKHKIAVIGKLKNDVIADNFRMYQVLVNLINNAIKYSPEGGKIIVRLQQNQNHALISVKDYGIGIEKIHQKKIFEKLYQATQMKEKSASGLGIGLYVSSEIIKHHGGKIWVESQKGKGAKFYFTLPLAKNASSHILFL